MSNKGKYKTLSGVTPKTDDDVILETWDIQDRKLQTSHLGLSEFLNKLFNIKKVTADNNENSEANAR